MLEWKPIKDKSQQNAEYKIKSLKLKKCIFGSDTVDDADAAACNNPLSDVTVRKKIVKNEINKLKRK